MYLPAPPSSIIVLNSATMHVIDLWSPSGVIELAAAYTGATVLLRRMAAS
jgi:hypothetical protein